MYLKKGLETKTAALDLGTFHWSLVNERFGLERTLFFMCSLLTRDEHIPKHHMKLQEGRAYRQTYVSACTCCWNIQMYPEKKCFISRKHVLYPEKIGISKCIQMISVGRKYKQTASQAPVEHSETGGRSPKVPTPQKNPVLLYL